MSRTAFALFAGYALVIVSGWFGLRAAGVGAAWRIIAVLILGSLFLFYVFSRRPPGNAEKSRVQETPAER